ncbi:class I SAM-dependent methyltransferase [Methanomicrobium antiquum]|uniref:Class I SAM-dependent methyltransferase n=1 Tax=Methanomicrobium antiquum TaxID=487686 RepID=A0AAF0FUK6_9EURY|nr:class I SAM-dependent methyltransferase [Methanomicrobium antiquum]WFN36788.1 class I SAM-dependent methyltransferase [Methanomicrobium antiquum]
MTNIKCKICGGDCEYIDSKKGEFLSNEEFDLYYCRNCNFFFVSNPSYDKKLYDEAYYHGKGADPLINYIYEIENPDKSIRLYEYEGILKTINAISGNKKNNWLDIGCGAGGLIKYVSKNSEHNINGFDTGYGAVFAKKSGIDILTEKEYLNSKNKYDVITAIETLEHVDNPKVFMDNIQKALKPGGIFFFTTGNVDPIQKNIMKWNYFIPEIHICLFSEKSINNLFESVGLQYCLLSKEQKKGWTNIYKYKILKNLHITNSSIIYNVFPWQIISNIIDKKYKLCWGIGIKKN